MFKKNLEKVALPYLPCVNTFSKKAITQPKKFCFENPFGGDDDEGSCMVLLKNNIQFLKKVKQGRPSGIPSFAYIFFKKIYMLKICGIPLSCYLQALLH